MCPVMASSSFVIAAVPTSAHGPHSDSYFDDSGIFSDDTGFGSQEESSQEDVDFGDLGDFVQDAPVVTINYLEKANEYLRLRVSEIDPWRIDFDEVIQVLTNGNLDFRVVGRVLEFAVGVLVKTILSLERQVLQITETLPGNRHWWKKSRMTCQATDSSNDQQEHNPHAHNESFSSQDSGFDSPHIVHRAEARRRLSRRAVIPGPSHKGRFIADDESEITLSLFATTPDIQVRKRKIVDQFKRLVNGDFLDVEFDIHSVYESGFSANDFIPGTLDAAYYFQKFRNESRGIEGEMQRLDFLEDGGNSCVTPVDYLIRDQENDENILTGYPFDETPEMIVGGNENQSNADLLIENVSAGGPVIIAEHLGTPKLDERNTTEGEEPTRKRKRAPLQGLNEILEQNESKRAFYEELFKTVLQGENEMPALTQEENLCEPALEAAMIHHLDNIQNEEGNSVANNGDDIRLPSPLSHEHSQISSTQNSKYSTPGVTIGFVRDNLDKILKKDLGEKGEVSLVQLLAKSNLNIIGAECGDSGNNDRPKVSVPMAFVACLDMAATQKFYLETTVDKSIKLTRQRPEEQERSNTIPSK